MPVGHTHEDIDQFFGRLSNTLLTGSFKTPPAFLDLLNGSIKTTPVNAEFLHTPFEIKDWIAPCLNNVNGHSEPHYFLWQKGLNGAVMFSFKDRAEEEWILSKLSLLSAIPRGNPAFVKVDSEVLKKFGSTLDRMAAVLSQEEISEWRTWALASPQAKPAPFSLHQIPRVADRVARGKEEKEETYSKSIEELLERKPLKTKVTRKREQ